MYIIDNQYTVQVVGISSWVRDLRKKQQKQSLLLQSNKEAKRILHFQKITVEYGTIRIFHSGYFNFRGAS